MPRVRESASGFARSPPNAEDGSKFSFTKPERLTDTPAEEKRHAFIFHHSPRLEASK